MTTLSREAERWVEAGKALAADNSAAVASPSCQDGRLSTQDVIVTTAPAALARHLVCDKCGATNVLRLRIHAPRAPSTDR